MLVAKSVPSSLSETYERVTLSIDRTKGSIVQEERLIQLKSPESTHRISGIPSGVNFASVHLFCKQFYDATVSRKTYVPPTSSDHVDFLQSHLNSQISLTTKDGKKTAGSLVQVTECGLIIEVDGDKQRFLWDDPSLEFAQIDKVPLQNSLDLLSQQSSCDVTIKSEKSENSEMELVYTCPDISWEAQYQIRLNHMDRILQVSGFYNVQNNSNKNFPEARLRMILPERKVTSPFEGKPDATFSVFSSKVAVFQGKSPLPTQAFLAKDLCDLNAFSKVEIPFTAAKMPYETIFWLDANFSDLEEDCLSILEADINKKYNSFLYDAILFKNSSKRNLPPGQVQLYYLNYSDKQSTEYKEPFFGPIQNIKTTDFSGCYLDQSAILPIKSCPAVKCVKERKSFKLEEKSKKITESYVITITNEMRTSDIFVRELFPRAKKWTLSKQTPEKFTIIDTSSVSWHIPAMEIGTTEEIKYTVTYTWEETEVELLTAGMQPLNNEEMAVFDDDEDPEEREEVAKKGFFSLFSKGGKKKKT